MDYIYKNFYNDSDQFNPSYVELIHYKDKVLSVGLYTDMRYMVVKLDPEAMDEFVKYIKENF